MCVETCPSMLTACDFIQSVRRAQQGSVCVVCVLFLFWKCVPLHVCAGYTHWSAPAPLLSVFLQHLCSIVGEVWTSSHCRPSKTVFKQFVAKTSWLMFVRTTRRGCFLPKGGIGFLFCFCFCTNTSSPTHTRGNIMCHVMGGGQVGLNEQNKTKQNKEYQQKEMMHIE